MTLKITLRLLFSGLFFLLIVMSGKSTESATIDSCDYITCNRLINMSVPQGQSYSPNLDVFLEGFYCRSHTYLLEYSRDGNDPWLTWDMVTDSEQGRGHFKVTDLDNGTECWGEVEISVVNCSDIECEKNVSYTIKESEMLPVDLDKLLVSSYCDPAGYKVTYDAGNGIFQPLIEINASLPRNFEYKVSNAQFGLECSGQIDLTVIDCDKAFQPFVEFNRIDINCWESSNPLDVGFPIPDTAEVVGDSITGFVIRNWSPCEDINFGYFDYVESGSCQEPYEWKITRTWTFYLEDTRTIMPVDTIYVARMTFDDLLPLKDFNGTDAPALNCNDSWNDGSDIPPVEITGSPIRQGVDCTTMVAQQDDVIFVISNNRCNTIKKILRQWTVLDWCTGELEEIRQIIRVECSDDEEIPVSICTNELDLILGSNGRGRVYVENVNDGSYDDCGIARLSFDEVQNLQFVEFNDQQVGSTQEVTLYVEDYVGNINACKTDIRVLSNPNGDGNVGGKYYSYNSNRLEDFSFLPDLTYEVTNNSIKRIVPLCSAPSGEDIDYAVCLDESGFAGPYQLDIKSETPQNALEGISVKDYIDLIRIVLSLTKANPYLLIAADLNMDNAVSVLDAYLIRGIILGEIAPPANPWRFFTKEANPQPISTTSFSSLPDFSMDIVPVKMGDLDHQELNGITGKNETRSGRLDMYFEERDLVAGQTYELELFLEGSHDIIGIQLGQTFESNAIEVLNVSPLNISPTGGDWAGYENEWRYVLVENNLEPFAIEGSWLKVMIESNVNKKLSEVMDPDNRSFQMIAIDDLLNTQEVKIEVREFPTSTNNTVVDRLKTYPNPFADMVIIELGDVGAGSGIFKLMSIDGRELYTESIKDLKVRRVIELNNEHFSGPGYYLGVLQTEEQRHVVKLLKK